MPTATWEAALRVHKALGIERGVIVQTTTYGADHSVVLDGLAAMGPNYRGCANALVFAEADDAYLEKLHAAGVRGARFSFRQELGRRSVGCSLRARHRPHQGTGLVCEDPARKGRYRQQRRQISNRSTCRS